MAQNQSWLSAYLYYNEPWEVFLAKAVAPYIQTVLKTGIAESYFFIRYWNRGPHIRLRFKGEATVLEEVLKPNLTEHFRAYIEANPSERRAPEYPENYPKEHYWLPNNTIQFEQYVPETNRYGGSEGLSLSEKQFQLSSFTVLEYLKASKEDNNYDEALGVAIRLHLGFIHSIGLKGEMAVHFFNMIYRNWLPRTFKGLEKNTPEDLLQNKMRETIEQFEVSFQEQKEGLVEFHKELLNNLKSGDSFESTTFNRWIEENRILGLLLNSAAESGNLEDRVDAYGMTATLEDLLSNPAILCWNIWADHVHMTNNRLGIINQDEAYLAYLMKRSLETIQAI